MKSEEIEEEFKLIREITAFITAKTDKSWRYQVVNEIFDGIGHGYAEEIIAKVAEQNTRLEAALKLIDEVNIHAHSESNPYLSLNNIRQEIQQFKESK
jgi:hypothetical protein